MYKYQSRQDTQSSTNSWNSIRSDGSVPSRSSRATSCNSDLDKTYYSSDYPTPIPLERTQKHITYGNGVSVTVGSFDSDRGYFDEPEDIDDSQYQPAYEPVSSTSFEPTDTIDFPKYFPTHNRLSIQHDTTEDGNFNLVVSTQVSESGRQANKQLFHLRMHDLPTRDFSFRRYCREAGREICKCKTGKAGARRPTIGRSVSNALLALRRTNSDGSQKSDKLTTSTKTGKVIRQDSGYESETSAFDSDVEDEDDDEYSDSSASFKGPTDNIKVEFTNYAHMDVRRLGTKAHKHWAFEYYGEHYSWKRKVVKDALLGKQCSYHLMRSGLEAEVARIMPNLRTPQEQRDEERMGGWVPPCTLWIQNEEILSKPDVAEAIVAAGLIALTDDSLRSLEKKKTKKPSRQLSFKVGNGQRVDVDLVTPLKMMEHMFPKSKKERSRPGTPKRNGAEKVETIPASPLRYQTPVHITY